MVQERRGVANTVPIFKDSRDKPIDLWAVECPGVRVGFALYLDTS